MRTFNLFSAKRALIVALVAFLPMVVISIVSSTMLTRSDFPSLPNGNLSNLETVADLGEVHANADSWGPMLRALQVLRSNQADRLYETMFFEQKDRFQYPPSSLIALDVLDHLGKAAVYHLNKLNLAIFAGNALAIGVLAYLLQMQRSSAQGVASRVTALPLALVAVLAGALYYPLLCGYILGQIQVWIDLLFTLACLAWITDRRFLAGVAIGATCSIKPQFAVLLLWAVIWKDWRFVKGILAIALPLAAISVWHYGFSNHLSYMKVLSFLSERGESFYANNSVNGIVSRLLGVGTNLIWRDGEFSPFNRYVYFATLGATISALAVVLGSAVFRKTGPTVFDFGIAALLTTISSPVAWQHHYGIALPLYVVVLVALLAEQPSPQRSWKLIALAISWTLTANVLVFTGLLADSMFNVLQANFFIGGIILTALLLIAARPEASWSSGGIAPKPA